MKRVSGDNAREMAVKKLFGLAGPSVMRGCLQVFEDEVWTAFMRKEVSVATVREHIRSRFCIPIGEDKDQAIDQIVLDVLSH